MKQTVVSLSRRWRGIKGEVGRYLLLIILFGWPARVMAQILPDNPVAPVPGVPVPFHQSFFAWPGPAGRVTATGVILAIISIALWIVGLLAVLFLIVGGFRYITAHGNEEAAESAKKTIQQAIVGLVIVILSFVIVRVISSALVLGRVGA